MKRIDGRRTRLEDRFTIPSHAPSFDCLFAVARRHQIVFTSLPLIPGKVCLIGGCCVAAVHDSRGKNSRRISSSSIHRCLSCCLLLSPPFPSVKLDLLCTRIFSLLHPCKSGDLFSPSSLSLSAYIDSSRRAWLTSQKDRKAASDVCVRSSAKNASKTRSAATKAGEGITAMIQQQLSSQAHKLA